MSLTALLLTVVLASVWWSLGRSDPGLVGTNGIRPDLFVTNLSSGATVCQPLSVDRGPSDKLRMTVGTYGEGPQPLKFYIQGGRKSVIESRYGQGVAYFGLPTSRSKKAEALCVVNEGTAPVALAGEAVPGASRDGKPRPYSLSLGIVRRPRTWGSRLGELRSRLSRGQVDLGGAAPALALSAALACLIGSVVVLTRTL